MWSLKAVRKLCAVVPFSKMRNRISETRGDLLKVIHTKCQLRLLLLDSLGSIFFP